MTDNDSMLELTVSIVCAYVAYNSVQRSAVADLIDLVSASLVRTANVEPKQQMAVPAVSVSKSVTPEYLVSLEDGRRFKSLKRHLRTSYGMTPNEYRQKWGLPASYPMVAPAYAAKRSQLAKDFGLGRQTSELVVREQKAAGRKPGRPRKARPIPVQPKAGLDTSSTPSPEAPPGTS